MIVKVCGMREPDNIRRVEQAGPDWMGFIFFPHSSRYVSCRPAYLPEQCKRICQRKDTHHIAKSR